MSGLLLWAGNTNIHPLVSKDEYSKRTMKQMVKGYFEGSFSNVVSFMVKENNISVEELESLLQQIKKQQNQKNETLLFYLLQLVIASGILYGYYHFFLRNKKFHQYNRYYLLAATVIHQLLSLSSISRCILRKLKSDLPSCCKP